jgi:hypothetical protein
MLGQVKRAVDQRVPFVAGVGEEDTDLAVFDPPRSAAVLARHPGRMRAFLQEPCFVDYQHTVGAADVLDYIIPADIP